MICYKQALIRIHRICTFGRKDSWSSSSIVSKRARGLPKVSSNNSFDPHFSFTTLYLTRFASVMVSIHSCHTDSSFHLLFVRNDTIIQQYISSIVLYLPSIRTVGIRHRWPSRRIISLPAQRRTSHQTPSRQNRSLTRSKFLNRLHSILRTGRNKSTGRW